MVILFRHQWTILPLSKKKNHFGKEKREEELKQAPKKKKLILASQPFSPINTAVHHYRRVAPSKSPAIQWAIADEIAGHLRGKF